MSTSGILADASRDVSIGNSCKQSLRANKSAKKQPLVSNRLLPKLRKSLCNWVDREIRLTFPGPSEHAIIAKACPVLGISEHKCRSLLRGDTEKPDVAIALFCRALRGAEVTGGLLEDLDL